MRGRVSSYEGRVARYELRGGLAVSQEGLEKFGAFRKENQLFDLVVEDMSKLKENPLCWRLIGQQIGSADSICANIEEGYGRGSRKEYAHFLTMARGSARETRGRYMRMKHWLPWSTINPRVAMTDEIISILSASIEKLRNTLEPKTKPPNRHES